MHEFQVALKGEILKIFANLSIFGALVHFGQKMTLKMIQI